jgi:hypothetical protein
MPCTIYPYFYISTYLSIYINICITQHDIICLYINSTILGKLKNYIIFLSFLSPIADIHINILINKKIKQITEKTYIKKRNPADQRGFLFLLYILYSSFIFLYFLFILLLLLHLSLHHIHIPTTPR